MSEFPFNHLDDVSFNLALYELADGPVRFNNDRLECLYFNPISNCNTVISSDSGSGSGATCRRSGSGSGDDGIVGTVVVIVVTSYLVWFMYVKHLEDRNEKEGMPFFLRYLISNLKFLTILLASKYKLSHEI